MNGNDLIPHLFRTEYGKLVSVLTKTFGIDQMEVAQDIASDTFLLAVETWPYKGIPENPTAWLYVVARNKAKNIFARNHVYKTKITRQLTKNEKQFDEIEVIFSDENIADSQLQMLFTICHPSISVESQICLALRILCGLGLNEIADAFLTNKETIHKRLQRAKAKLLSEKISLDMPTKEQLGERLDAVKQTLYLLFSEGYYSESNPSPIRKELCFESLNLAYLLLKNPQTNTHSTNALISLMCFQSSRLDARQSMDGSIVLYEDQNKQLWNTELIEKGFYYLQQASKWEITSTYYLEASIAYWHTVRDEMPDKWTSILQLYDALLAIENSPIIGLNRIFALSKVHGKSAAIVEAEKLNLTKNHFYFILLAELYKEIDPDKTLQNYLTAYELCKSDAEKNRLKTKIREAKNTPT